MSSTASRGERRTRAGAKANPKSTRKYAEPDTPLDDVVAGRATNRDAANASG